MNSEIFRNFYQKTNSICLFLFDQKFLNPKIESELNILSKNKALHSNISELLFNLESLQISRNKMIFPAPILREFHTNSLKSLVNKYSKDFIYVDINQDWYFKKNKLDKRMFNFFLNNLNYCSETELYYVEYWAENHYDKAYLFDEITPMNVTNYSTRTNQVTLNHQFIDNILENTLNLTADEQLWVQTEKFGKALVNEKVRFNWIENLELESKQIKLEGSILNVVEQELKMKAPLI